MLLLCTSAGRVSPRTLSGEWLLDVRMDSAAFFSADTLRFTNQYALPGTGDAESVKHRPALIIGYAGDLYKNQFYVSVENNTIQEERRYFYGTFHLRAGEVVFLFRGPDESGKSIDQRKPWFSRKYLVSRFRKGKTLELVKRPPNP
jgi:hypothetical protein